MSNADALRSLTQDMAQAHEERTRRIAEIGKETARLLNRFDKEHQAMGKRLTAELAKAEKERRSQTQAEISERKSEVSSLLDGFDKQHQAMSQELRAELAKVRPELATAEAERRSEDQAEIRQMESEVSSLLDGFDKQHQAMSQELRAELAKVRPELATAEAERKSRDQAEIRQMESEVSSLLDDFDKQHQAMSQELRAKLASDESQRKTQTQAEIRQRQSEVSGLLDRFGAEAKERADEVISIRSEAGDLVEGFRRDSADTAAAWRDLVATMQAKRGMAAAPRPARPPVAEAVEEEVPVEKVAPEEKGELQNRILDLIMEHAEGIKLIEMTEATGEARVKLGNITRMLLDEGKIRKEGLLYFPAQRP